MSQKGEIALNNQTVKGQVKGQNDELRELIRQELQAILEATDDQFPNPPPGSADQVGRMIGGLVALPFNLIGSLLEGVGSALRAAGAQVGNTLKP